MNIEDAGVMRRHRKSIMMVAAATGIAAVAMIGTMIFLTVKMVAWIDAIK